MHLQAIWRYPVKSLAGEPLQEAAIGPLGIEGDRERQVRDRHGRVVTARSHPRLLGLRADTVTEAQVVEVVGPGAQLTRDDGSVRFDVLPLLVATDGSLQAFGRDLRRLRPNLVIAGVEGLAERGWERRVLRVGSEVEIFLDSLRERCVMTTYDPDTQVRDIEVLRDIRHRFDGRLALNARVLRGGRVRVGDPVELVAPATFLTPDPTRF